jgi:hypothetical protein
VYFARSTTFVPTSLSCSFRCLETSSTSQASGGDAELKLTTFVLVVVGVVGGESQSFKATLNDPKYRSVNRNATAGSPNDIYKHNPWRAPGNAPVGDACGFAGGTPWIAEGPEAGDYSVS